MTTNTQTNEHEERVELARKLNAGIGPNDSLSAYVAAAKRAAAMLDANALHGSVSKNRMKQLSAALGNPLTVEAMEGDSVEDALIELATARLAADAQRPIDMVLYCPKCGMQHIDKPNALQKVIHAQSGVVLYETWTNPPHKSHLCHGCGHIWRPSDAPTNGVERTASGKDADTAPVWRPARRPLLDFERRRIVEQFKGGNWTAGDIIDAVEAAHNIKEQP